jgi:hypothetical protein
MLQELRPQTFWQAGAEADGTEKQKWDLPDAASTCFFGMQRVLKHFIQKHFAVLLGFYNVDLTDLM